jgi:hypothetical protein
MDRRLILDPILRELAPNVYFQPPSNAQMKYPCILYNLDTQTVQRADNRPYLSTDRYVLTVIDKDPDSHIWRNVVERFPMAAHQRWYPADGLNHHVINLHF